MVHLDYRDTRPIYLQIMDGFREQIATGVLQPGDKLPSVRELAASLAINPNTIQRSYKLLEMDGWIATVPGKGCFVSRNQKALQQEIDRWYAALDEAAENLATLGITTEQIIEHLKKPQRQQMPPLKPSPQGED